MNITEYLKIFFFFFVPQHAIITLGSECYFAECHIFIVMLAGVMLVVIYDECLIIIAILGALCSVS
jgi:hypothetical protein